MTLAETEGQRPEGSARDQLGGRGSLRASRCSSRKQEGQDLPPGMLGNSLRWSLVLGDPSAALPVTEAKGPIVGPQKPPWTEGQEIFK